MTNDPINRPSHYNSGAIEVIEAIEDWKLGFNRGNSIKYISRAGKKDPTKEIEDLEKAKWYINREIELLKAVKEQRPTTRPNDMNPPNDIGLTKPSTASPSISATVALTSPPPGPFADFVENANKASIKSLSGLSCLAGEWKHDEVWDPVAKENTSRWFWIPRFQEIIDAKFLRKNIYHMDMWGALGDGAGNDKS